MAGLGQACFFVYSSQNAVGWFPQQKYMAIGITSCGVAVGGMIYPLTLKFLVSNLGFPVGARLFSAVVGVTSFIAFIGGCPNPDVIKRPLGPLLKFSTWVDRNALETPAFLQFSAAICSIFLGYYPVAFYVTEWAQRRGLGTKEDIMTGTGERPGDSGFRTFWLLTIMNGCSIIGRIGGAGFAVK